MMSELPSVVGLDKHHAPPLFRLATWKVSLLARDKLRRTLAWQVMSRASAPCKRSTANEEPLTETCRRSGEGLLRARRPAPGTGWHGPARACAGSLGFACSFKRQHGFRSVDGSMDALPLERELDDRAGA